MSGPHENLEHAEHAQHAGSHNKGIALLIAVIALFLAFSETLGKSAQTTAISANVEASNLWAFFQAKTIRMTVIGTATEAMEAESTSASDPAARERMTTRIDQWRKTVARYNDEPDTGEGRKQLVARAKAAEHSRDTALARYHHYEVASAAFQIGIELSSAAIITGMMVLAWLAGGLAILGLAFTAFGFLGPHAVHII
jgi:hypothetical protein